MINADKISKAGSGLKDISIGLAIIAAMAAVVFVGYEIKKGIDAVGHAKDAVGKAIGDAVHSGVRYAGHAADAVGRAVDPTADTNLAYKASNNVVGCGDGSCSIGTKVYDGVQSVKGWFK